MTVVVVGPVIVAARGRRWWRRSVVSVVVHGVADAAAGQGQGDGAEHQEQRCCSLLSHREILSVWLVHAYRQGLWLLT